MVKPKVNRRHGRKLVEFADDDQWEKCLAILLKRKGLLEDDDEQNEQQRRLVWLGATTEGGDGLIHLASFAACDTSMTLVDRQRALQSLELILEAEMFTINRPAGDGGTALHSAMAAASSTFSFDNDDDIESYNEIEDEHNDAISSSDEEESNHGDSSAAGLADEDELLSEFDGLNKMDEQYRHLNSEEITCQAIKILLDCGADPDLPLVAAGTMENDNDDNDDEIELSYAREAIDEQWTPFTMALQWCILAGLEAAGGGPTAADTAAEQKQEQFVLALTVLRHMFDAGANPLYPIGANVHWNAFEFLTSASHRLSACQTLSIQSDALLMALPHRSRQGDDSSNHDTTSASTGKVMISINDCLENLLLQYAAGTENPVKCLPLSSDQKFAARIIANNPPADYEQDEVNSLGSKMLSEMLPLPQTFWSVNEQRKTWTLLDSAVAVFAEKSVKFLLQDRHLREKNTIMTIEILFASNLISRHNSWSGTSSEEITNFEEDTRRKQRDICSNLIKNTVLSTAANDDGTAQKKKQQLLDRLLLRTCGGKWGSASAVNILLNLGADPNTCSTVKIVEGGLLPIHFVAANYRGRNGLAMVNELISAEGNSTLTNEAGETALDIALKKRNFVVAKRLWEAQGKLHEDGTSSENYLMKALSLGEAAIACQDVFMLKEAVDWIRNESNGSFINSVDNSTDNGSWSQQSRVLGKLLLLCIDERSSFGTSHSTSANDQEDGNSNSMLIDAVNLILGEENCNHPCSFEVDEISNHSPIHLLLRSDRGLNLRNELLPKLCQLAVAADTKGHTIHDTEGRPVKRVSLRCDRKFGCYSALSMACALQCETSIKTLLQFGADPCTKDSQGNLPKAMICDPTQLSSETLNLLGFECVNKGDDEEIGSS